MANRLRRKLFNHAERPSLRMTNLAVEYFSQNVSPKLGKVDMHFAAAVTKNARVNPCTLMLAFVYVDRLRLQNPEYLHKVSSSDLFLVSMMVASKFLHDEGEDEEILNDQWASFAFMDIHDVNQLEREFLAALDWNVFVSADTLKHIVNRTESVLALHEGRVQGWFSYTDLDILSDRLRTKELFFLIMDQILKVTVVCAVTYAAGILTLVASTCTVSRIMGLSTTVKSPQLFLNTTPPCLQSSIPEQFLIDADYENILDLLAVLPEDKPIENVTFSRKTPEIGFERNNLSRCRVLTRWSSNRITAGVAR